MPRCGLVLGLFVAQAVVAPPAFAQQAVPLSVCLVDTVSETADMKATEVTAALVTALRERAGAAGATVEAQAVRAAVRIEPTVSVVGDKYRVRLVLIGGKSTRYLAWEFKSPRVGTKAAIMMMDAALKEARATLPDAVATEASVTAPVEEEPSLEAGRVRWGLLAGGGTFLPGPMVHFGGQARVGWQFNRLVGVALAAGGAAGFFIGGSVSSTGGSLNLGVASYYHAGLEAEVTLADLFFVAAGPHLTHANWAFLGQSVEVSGAASQRAFLAGGWMPAVDARLGFTFGRRDRDTGRRAGFTLAIDAMFLFALNTVTGSQVVNQGGVSQAVDVKGTAIGIAPMLLVGYDAR